jgi:S-(hydroxymethyl)glutathione dehydrogenase/alcohol dehydrogenase
MSSSVLAAVLRRVGDPLRVERLELADPGPGDVLVRLGAAGLCHTDLEVMRGAIAMPLPMVLGHEGAGVVVAVGEAVQAVRPGDHVVLSWNPACGRCYYCDRDQPLLCETCARAAGTGSLPDGRRPLRDGQGTVAQFMFMGAHADHVVVAEAAAVPVPRELPFSIGAAIGCGITTGLVPAMSSPAATLPDAVVAVVGCGIVGLSAIAGARLAGVKVIAAIDRSVDRLELAGRLGADVMIDTSGEDAVARVRDLSAGRGADHVFEAAGTAAAMRTAFESVRPGGELTMLGKLALDDDLVIRFGSLMGNKTVRRLAYGGAQPQRDFPRIARLYLDGQLPLDALIDREVPLADIDATFADVERGALVRAVVRFP